MFHVIIILSFHASFLLCNLFYIFVHVSFSFMYPFLHTYSFPRPPRRPPREGASCLCHVTIIATSLLFVFVFVRVFVFLLALVFVCVFVMSPRAGASRHVRVLLSFQQAEFTTLMVLFSCMVCISGISLETRNYHVCFK